MLGALKESYDGVKQHMKMLQAKEKEIAHRRKVIIRMK